MSASLYLQHDQGQSAFIEQIGILNQFEMTVLALQSWFKCCRLYVYGQVIRTSRLPWIAHRTRNMKPSRTTVDIKPQLSWIVVVRSVTTRLVCCMQISLLYSIPLIAASISSHPLFVIYFIITYGASFLSWYRLFCGLIHVCLDYFSHAIMHFLCWIKAGH